MQRTDRLRWDDLDLGSFGDRPLDPAALRCIRSMHDVEFHTVCYLRELLLTRAHRDPETTAFLSLWVAEEHWHGEGLAAVLEAHGEEAGSGRVARMRSQLGVRDRLRPLLIGLGGWCAGEDFVAVQMAWGAVNEWTTQAGYSRLAARAGHPVLTALLRRSMRQEGRHVDFYASRARDLLERSGSARRITRAALRHLWRPVGSGVMPRDETRFLLDYLLAGEDGRRTAARVDRRIDRLPGLAGLGLLGRARSAAS